MSAPARICIVSSGCLSTGPRVVKEADALAAAGYAVHVIVCHWMAGQAEWDERLARGKRWTWSAFRRDAWRRVASPPALAGSALRRVGRMLARATGPLAPIDEIAQSNVTVPLGWHASRQRADLFIAHNLAALPVASRLARRSGARLAFDAEDDHFAELPPQEQDSLEGRLRDTLLARHLPRCDLVTTSSEEIADGLSERYGIARPTPVHNVFPWALRSTIDGAVRDRIGPGASLYWYSQSIGLDRGLQDAVRAMAELPRNTELHIRGRAPRPVRDAVESLARDVGVGPCLHWHEPVHPDELLSRTAEHDVGLALEQPVNDNRLRTVTNKFFFYLLGGLAVAASDTPGQRRVLSTAPAAGFLYPPGDAKALGAELASLVGDRARLASAKRAALAAAEHRWCWERERTRLLDAVGRVLR